MSAAPAIFDDRVCLLGEGPLWHPTRNELFWVDIPSNTILSKREGSIGLFHCAETPSALGWIDHERLVVATESGLHSMCAESGRMDRFCAIEAEVAGNRSNDGRTDPWGGFWIGTMGKQAEPGAGSMYRWYRGTLRTVHMGLTVPNGTCFDLVRQRAYFVDSARKLMFSVALDATGWPTAVPRLFLDFNDQKWTIDGAITDAQGCIWCALWDGAAMARFSPQGHKIAEYPTGTERPTCPAFGGRDARDIYLTTASIGLEPSADAAAANCGRTLVFPDIVQGSHEPCLILQPA